MSVDVPQGTSQKSVRRFLQSHYAKYWKESFTCYTFSKDDTLPVLGVMNDFKHDIMNDLVSWKSAGFVGKFSIYVHPSTSPEALTRIDFTVEQTLCMTCIPWQRLAPFLWQPQPRKRPDNLSAQHTKKGSSYGIRNCFLSFGGPSRA